MLLSILALSGHLALWTCMFNKNKNVIRRLMDCLLFIYIHIFISKKVVINVFSHYCVRNIWDICCIAPLLLQVRNTELWKRFNLTNREISPTSHLSLTKISNLAIAPISMSSSGILGETNVTYMKLKWSTNEKHIFHSTVSWAVEDTLRSNFFLCVCVRAWFRVFIQIKEKKQRVRNGLGNVRISRYGLGIALWMFSSC